MADVEPNRPTERASDRNRAVEVCQPPACLGCGKFHTKESLVSAKDCLRRYRVKQLLDEGQNPYSNITTEVKEVIKPITSVCRKAITMESIKRVISKRVTSKLIDNYIPKNPVCMRCRAEITGLLSHVVRVLSNFTKIVKYSTVPIVDPNYRLLNIETGSQVVEYPVFSKGLMCQSCCDYLYPYQWIDKDGNTHRMIEYLIPKVTVLDRGKEGNLKNVANTNFVADDAAKCTTGLSGHPGKGRTTKGSRIKMRARHDVKSGPCYVIDPTTGERK